MGEKMTCALQRSISQAGLLASDPVILVKHTSRAQQFVTGTLDDSGSLRLKATQSSPQFTRSGKQYDGDILNSFPFFIKMYIKCLEAATC